MDDPTVAIGLEQGTCLVIVEVRVVVSKIVEVIVPVADVSASERDMRPIDNLLATSEVLVIVVV